MLIYLPMLLEMVATGFFVGKLPFAPGTFGTLVGIPLVLFLSVDQRLYWAGLALVFFLGWLSAEWMVRAKGEEDPEEVVIDEIFGFMVLFLWTEPTAKSLAVGFVLFRLLDILKPFPIKFFEGLPGGLGVMADDGVAGLMGALLLKLLFS